MGAQFVKYNTGWLLRSDGGGYVGGWRGGGGGSYTC